jgi:hypothetical protein
MSWGISCGSHKGVRLSPHTSLKEFSLKPMPEMSPSPCTRGEAPTRKWSPGCVENTEGTQERLCSHGGVSSPTRTQAE